MYQVSSYIADDEASLLLEEDGEKRTRESVGANSEVGSGVG
jgi:hypothetical protein